jgi:hypothetical protein
MISKALINATQLRSVTLPVWVGVHSLKMLARNQAITSITLLYLDVNDVVASDMEGVEEAVAQQPDLVQLVSFEKYPPPPVGNCSSGLGHSLTTDCPLTAPQNACNLTPYQS